MERRMPSNKLDVLLARVAQNRGVPLSDLQKDLLQKSSQQIIDDHEAFDAHIHISFEEAVQHNQSKEIRERYEQHLKECSFCTRKLELTQP